MQRVVQLDDMAKTISFYMVYSFVCIVMYSIHQTAYLCIIIIKKDMDRTDIGIKHKLCRQTSGTYTVKLAQIEFEDSIWAIRRVHEMKNVLSRKSSKHEQKKSIVEMVIYTRGFDFGNIHCIRVVSVQCYGYYGMYIKTSKNAQWANIKTFVIWVYVLVLSVRCVYLEMMRSKSAIDNV